MDLRRLAIACLALAACGRLDFSAIPPDGGNGSGTPGTCIAEVKTGELASCAVRTDGALYCWGSNVNGQLGTGDRSSTPTPVDVPVSAFHIAAGQRHTCAVVDSDPGTVACWGDNSVGQLGDGTTERRIGPTATVSLTGVAHIAAGGATSCAATASAVYCWGDNSSGQLGDGTHTSSATPVQTSTAAGPMGVKFLSVGAHHVCAIDNANAVWCWGNNADGQLGDGTTDDAEKPVNIGFSAKVVRAGGTSTCAIAMSDEVYCWGNDSDGQLGNGADTTIHSSPQLIIPAVAGDTFSELDVADQHACATTMTGNVNCWGRDFARLGDGSHDRQESPVMTQVSAGVNLSGARSVGTAGDSSCALLSDGFDCWGQSDAGEVGDGMYQIHEYAVKGGPNGPWSAIAAGGYQMCALNALHQVKCWGSNAFGELGAPSVPTSSLTPVHIADNIAHVSVGAFHACAIGTDGLARCWGHNVDTLGTATPAEQPSPTIVPDVMDLQNVAVGDNHSCVLHANGKLSCWGPSLYAGRGSAVDQPTPGVIGIGGLLEANGGPQHACARSATETWCWGQNISGRLGTGTGNDELAPVMLVIPPTISISPGGQHTCAVDADRNVWCWGDGKEGQFADATAPAAVASPRKLAVFADEVASGDAHVCSRDGTSVRCWGRNHVGQTGASPTQSQPPTVIDGLSVLHLSAMADHTCALTTDNRVACWGGNDTGQLGDGTTISRATPQLVNVPCD